MILNARAQYLGLPYVTIARAMGLEGRSLMRAVMESVAPAEVWTSTNESNLAIRELLASEDWQFSCTLRGLDEGDAELVFYLRWMDV